MLRMLASAAAITIATGTAFAADMEVVKIATQGDVTYFTDSNDMTLYTFDKDEPGKSNCYDQCAVNWPPLVVEVGTSLPERFELIDRMDGTSQVAYDGKPLYLWVKDTKSGDLTGEGVGGVWHTAVAK